MSQQVIRWIQRFDNYEKALAVLQDAAAQAKSRTLSNLEKQGLIQAFEFTHELAWNTLKDFLEERGAAGLYGPKDVTREAFQAGLIEDGKVWMRMITSRNITSHTYNEPTANEIQAMVLNQYCQAFDALREKFEALRREELAK